MARWFRRTFASNKGCALVAASSFVACQGRPTPKPVPIWQSAWSVPAPDANGACRDVGDLRVCFRGKAPPIVVPRPVPSPDVSPEGFRCTGQGARRVCTDRELDAPPFACSGRDCTEQHLRLPDDGEWECKDAGGIVVCRGKDHAASPPKGASDPGYICGKSSGHRAQGERICVDLSPDFPHGSPRGVRCRFDATNGLARLCTEDPTAHVVTDACDRARPCISGLSCADGRCVPSEPHPSCWADRDCDQGSCRFGSCLEGAP